MRIEWLKVSLLAGFAASAFAAPRLLPSQLLSLVIVLSLVSIFCGWILIFQSRGMRRSISLREYLLSGFLFPVPSNWAKPVAPTWPAKILLLSASLLAGAMAGLLWVLYA